MYMNVLTSSVGQANAAGLGALTRRRRVVAVPRVIYRTPARGLRGLGSCSSLGYTYSNTPNGACIDSSTGNVVDCKATVCASASGSPVSVGPSFVPSPVIQNIPVGGFTGDLAVPTLASTLGDMLAAKESPFNANLLAKGVVTPAADTADFASLAQQHCTEYAASQGCDNPGAIAAQFAAQYTAWLKGQPAAAYQAGDSGSLFSPVAAITNRDPVPAGSSGGGGGAGSSGAVPVTVQLSNLTRPGQSLQVGDTWRVDITGAAGQPVTVSATQNGQSLGTTPMGSTKSDGTLSISATGDSSVQGSWSETWSVGGVKSSPLVFSVAAAPASGSGAGAGSGSSSGSSGGNSGGNATPPPPASSNFVLPAFLTQTFSIGSLTLPVWGFLAIGAGGLVLTSMGGKH